MGVIGFARFSRANDLGNGLLVYPVIGIAAALLTVIAALTAFLEGTSLAHAWPIYIAALFAVLHTFTTTRAAPLMLSLRQLTDDEATLTDALNRFAAWHNARTALQVLNFVMLVLGIVAYIGAHS